MLLNVILSFFAVLVIRYAFSLNAREALVAFAVVFLVSTLDDVAAAVAGLSDARRRTMAAHGHDR